MLLEVIMQMSELNDLADITLIVEFAVETLEGMILILQ